MRAQRWLSGAALAAMVPGLIWAPSLTWAVLTVCGWVMLASLAAVTAASIGVRSTIARASTGASAGPWAVLADRELATAAALELSAAAALAAIATAHFTARWPEVRRDGIAVFFALREAPLRAAGDNTSRAARARADESG